MTNIIKQNYLENFPNNEGRVNSKGMVAPPVPPRAPEIKLSSQNGTTKPKLASNPNEGKINSKGMVAPPVPLRAPETKLSSQNGTTKPKLASNPNEGRVNSKGMVAPPVPPRAPETKLSSQNGTTKPKLASNPNADKQFKYEVKLPGVIHTTARKNNVGGGLSELNLKKEANSAVSEPNAVKKKKVTFANPEISDNEYKPAVSLSTLFEYTEYMPQDKKAQTLNLALKGIMKTMPMYESVNAFDDTFEQNNYQKSSDPCLIPQKSEVLTAAKNELETIKFLKTLSKKERENLGFSPKQQDNHKVESSKKTYNPLNWNPIYQGKKRFSPERLNVHPLLRNKADIHGSVIAGTKPYSTIERCMVTHDGSELETKIERKNGFQSDLSIKHIKVDTAVCSITEGNDKKGVRPDASYKQEPLSEVSKINVKELANRFRG